MNPYIIEIDEGYQWNAWRNIFPGLNVALVDLRGDRSIDRHLVDDRLHGLDVGDGFADIRLRDLVLLFGVAIDRLIVGRLGLIDGSLALVQRIGGLVELSDRGIAALG